MDDDAIDIDALFWHDGLIDTTESIGDDEDYDDDWNAMEEDDADYEPSYEEEEEEGIHVALHTMALMAYPLPS